MKTTLNSDKLQVEILHKGAEVCSIKNKNGLEYMWEASPDVWPRHAPVLFPIVGKLKDNRYTHNGRNYELSQHGFARDQDFRLVSHTASSALFQLTSNSETRKNYPFDFLLEINYVLQGNQLGTTYKIVNRGSEKMFFNIGAHPGFRCPLLPGEKFEDYYLRFEKPDLKVTPLKDGTRLNERTSLHLKESRLPVTRTLFDNDALVFEDSQVNSVTLASRFSDHSVTIHCNGWPYFGIWAKKGSDRFVCLEPWFGVADPEESSGSLEEKPGVLSLEPGMDFCCNYITIIA